MTPNLSLFYTAHPDRQLPPLERLRTIRAEIMTPLGSLRGWASVIEAALQRTADPDPAILELQRNLAEASNGLSTTLLELTQPDALLLDQADAILTTFRDYASVQTERLQATVAQLAERLPAMEVLLPNFSPSLTYLTAAIQAVWDAIDALTNPAEMLPDDVLNWLSIRDTVRKQAFTGDPAAVSPLLNGLRSLVPEIRAEAATLLRHLHDLRAVAPLVHILDDTNQRVRLAAVGTLGVLGQPEAAEPIASLLHDLGAPAAHALHQLGDPRGVEFFITRLSAADPQLRQWSAVALGNLGDRRALEPLGACLHDPNSMVRSCAAQALEQLRELKSNDVS
jgi:HEAT repeat protein